MRGAAEQRMKTETDMARQALSGARIFDGTRLIDGSAVLIDGQRIAALVPAADIPNGWPRRQCTGLLAPGFIDCQVNGGGGVLFNDERSVDGIAVIGAAHRRFGTTGFLPTFITDNRARMAEAVAAADAAMAAGVPGLLGIHLEGPFINPERCGVHDRSFVRTIDQADITLIAGFDAGRMLVTLAPEVVPPATIARLSQAGVVVSAGHTTADPETIAAARTAGLTGFTHLFNAMPPLAGRAPGPVGAALADADCWISLIADLHHVSATSLRVAIAAKGWQRMMLITDAMALTGSDADGFTLLGRRISRRDGRLTTEDGTLAGSDLDMATAVKNAVVHLGLPLEAALHMAAGAPAGFLGLGHEIGRIAPGRRANLVLLDDDLAVSETWIDGVAADRA
jgi:N-acetylglucosamine-6-phosphate deacetylase